MTEATEIAGLGSASYNLGSRTMAFPELVSNTRELRAAADRKGVDVGLQLNVPLESALVDTVGNRYYLMVTGVQASAPAATLSDAREDVLRDLRTLQAYRSLEPRVSEYQSIAAVQGLMELAIRVNEATVDKTRAISVMHDLTFSSLQSDTQVRDSTEGTVRKAIMDQARVMGMLTQATPENMALRTVAVAVPQSKSIVVAQVGGTMPLTQETMRMVREGQIMMFQRDELSTAAPAGEGVEGPFSLDRLKERLGVTMPSGRKTEAPEKKAG
jgi:hypothetical protein